MIDRRALLAGGMAATLPLPARAGAPAHPAPDDEAFWATVAAEYDVPRDVIQLENGNWGAMPRPVRSAYEEAVARVNRDTSYYARRGMLADLAAARTFANCSGDTPQTLNDSVFSLVERELSSVKNLLYFESSADTLGLATITVTVDRRGSGRSCPRSCDPPAVDGQRPPRSTGRW
ncbi:hypothetical protein QE363_002291 [Sphingomonas sp. SORGH_AS870]|uniref:hypothetical protein n=1 Tax=Sphingomonas sp. SORGH_AS_0870 TaxID=3041801 RepID=UPI00285AEEE1|nr:hypothetical protein [Sphingomonas sp. SORGH_AS_0870]MDR6146498.1 hypothetical protein [Sphingomonas sp. SORGH_AS_0870]